MENQKLIATTYFMGRDEYGRDFELKCTLYDENGNPKLWAIYRGRSCMSKKDGEFHIMHSPSNRTKEETENHRFESVEDALECFEQFHAPIHYNPLQPKEPFTAD